MEIKLQTFKGRNVATGEEVEYVDRVVDGEVHYGLDEILVDGKRIGFASHQPGAGIRFVRSLTAKQEHEVAATVSEQRKAQGKPELSDVVVRPPAAEKLKAATK